MRNAVLREIVATLGWGAAVALGVCAAVCLVLPILAMCAAFDAFAWLARRLSPAAMLLASAALAQGVPGDLAGVRLLGFESRGLAEDGRTVEWSVSGGEARLDDRNEVHLRNAVVRVALDDGSLAVARAPEATASLYARSAFGFHGLSVEHPAFSFAGSGAWTIVADGQRMYASGGVAMSIPRSATGGGPLLPSPFEMHGVKHEEKP